jgi:hypothetical protein
LRNANADANGITECNSNADWFTYVHAWGVAAGGKHAY